MMTDQPTTAKRSARKGPRPRHVPIRTCVVCRGQATKRRLVRIVRDPDGVVVIDESGRRNGRGAYLCDKSDCWNRAINSDVLAKALKCELTLTVRDDLRRYAAEHSGDGDPIAKSGK